ncbi:MAG: TaqI-like C-terminal specificity domain-containing protein [bacterium]
MIFKHLGEIPFLNGGLFEIENWEFPLKIRNKAFGKMFKELFEHYNFTVREDTALDMEVAIDPEMLGKVFENLILTLEKNPKTDLRKATGSYYTPRVIVHFMCQQSLKEYLIEGATEKTSLSLNREKIEKLFTLNPATQISEEELTWLRSSFTTQEAERMKQLVLQCRVCDPAVGSGAFVVGMLHEMIAVIKLFDIVLKGTKEIRHENYDYQLKRKLIENCLYGVDIQEQAVRICELRLWLSLVVDYEGKDIPPLPNLSYRIRQGNSLIDQLFGYNVNLNLPQVTEKGEKLKQLIDSIQNDKHAYFYESDMKKKHEAELKILSKQCDLASFYLKLRQDQVVEAYESKYGSGLFGERRLKKAEEEERDAMKVEIKELDRLLLPAKNTKEKLIAVQQGKLKETEHTRRLIDTFVWKLDFAEVFREKDGFDIVIGNPPYISFYSNTGHDLTLEEKRYFIRYYNSLLNESDRTNSMNLFAERAMIISTGRGRTVFIVNKTLSVLPSYVYVRRFLLENGRIEYLITDLHPFEAIVDCIIFSIQNEPLLEEYPIKWYKGQIEEPVTVNVKEIRSNRNLEFHFSLYGQITAKIERADGVLGNLITINRGVNIGGCFDSFLCSEKKNSNYYRYLGGTHAINRYSYAWDHRDGYFCFDQGKEKELRDFGKTLVLGDPKRYLVPRLFIPESGQYLMCAYSEERIYGAYGIMVGTQKNDKYDLLYICALINSKLISFYAIEKEILRKGNKATPHIGVKGLNAIPCYLLDKKSQSRFVTIVEKILAKKRGMPTYDTKDFEAQIDQQVYKLYGLTEEEIEIVEGQL